MSVKLYHYTDEKGKKAIEASKTLKMSKRNKNSRYGKGVYFTSMDPTASKKAIADNNYDGRYNAMATRLMNKGRVDYYIAVTFKLSDSNLKKPETDRDIFVYEKEMKLKDFDYEIKKFEEFNAIILAAIIGNKDVGADLATVQQ